MLLGGGVSAERISIPFQDYEMEWGSKLLRFPLWVWGYPNFAGTLIPKQLDIHCDDVTQKLSHCVTDVTR